MNTLHTSPTLHIEGLRVSLPGTARPVLDGVDLDVGRGQTVALVGESGSGKTLTSRAALGMLPPGATASGTVQVDGQDVLAMDPRTLRRLRADTAAMIFQDPRAAINPVRRVGDFLTEALRHQRGHGPGDGAQAGAGAAGGGRAARAGGAAAVSARVVRRDAATGDDRRGADGGSGAAAGRRADDRPGRHDAGRDHRAAAGSSVPVRNGAAVRHARLGPGRRHRRPGGGDVRGADRRDTVRPRRCSPTPSIPIRRLCWRPRHGWTRLPGG